MKLAALGGMCLAYIYMYLSLLRRKCICMRCANANPCYSTAVRTYLLLSAVQTSDAGVVQHAVSTVRVKPYSNDSTNVYTHAYSIEI